MAYDDTAHDGGAHHGAYDGVYETGRGERHSAYDGEHGTERNDEYDSEFDGERSREAADVWIRRFRDDRDYRFVTDEHVERAVGVLRLVMEHSGRYGLAVVHPDDVGPSERCADDVRWAHTAIRSPDATYFMRVQEICGPNPERRTPAGSAAEPASDEPAWIRERTREFIGTGRLQLQIRSPEDQYCRKTARDSVTSTLEDKIPAVLEGFASAYRHRQQARRRRADWEKLRDQAMERYESEKIMEYIDAMSEQYHAMGKRRDYLTALERSLEDYEGEDKAALIRVVAELRERIENEDPGLHPEAIELDVPPPDDEDLERFMDGWSASGPFHAVRPYAGSDDDWQDDPMSGARGYGGVDY